MTVAMATVSLFFTACEDDVSQIGNSLTTSEVSINVDSLTYNLLARTIEAPNFESKSDYALLGSIRVPEYGALDCSYVTQFLPTETLNIPDTISPADVDSVKIQLAIPRNYITGDSLAPQQMKVFSLTKKLPQDIASNFNPEGYFNPNAPLAVKSYTLSGYTYNDSSYLSANTLRIKAELPVEFGREVFQAYKDDPDLFVWPQKLAEKWPGVYVTPSFGKGCIAPVQNTSIFAYYPKTVMVSEKDNEGNSTLVNKTVADSICLFTTAPEVLTSVNINYEPSDNLKNLIAEGKSIITTPGGYAVSITFPAREILEEYWKDEYNLGVINNLTFSIPATMVKNDYGIGMPPALLMVRTADMETFFSDGKLPDNKTSFTGIFSAEDNCYSFNSMRQYIVDMRAKGEGNIEDADVDFTLIPVTISTEDYTDSSTGSLVTVVTNITPYIIMPTMVELDTENVRIVFTFSNQKLN